jgi:hypothetical protein
MQITSPIPNRQRTASEGWGSFKTGDHDQRYKITNLPVWAFAVSIELDSLNVNIRSGILTSVSILF